MDGLKKKWLLKERLLSEGISRRSCVASIEMTSNAWVRAFAKGISPPPKAFGVVEMTSDAWGNPGTSLNHCYTIYKQKHVKIV